MSKVQKEAGYSLNDTVTEVAELCSKVEALTGRIEALEFSLTAKALKEEVPPKGKGKKKEALDSSTDTSGETPESTNDELPTDIPPKGNTF